MAKSKSLLLLFIFVVSAPAFAKSESWYVHLGLGGATDISYGEKYQAAVDGLAGDHTKIASDLGLYFLTGKSTIWGIASHGISHTITDVATEQSTSLTAVISGLSFMFFTGSEPGSGLFLRLDGGFGVLARSEKNRATSVFGEPKTSGRNTGWGGYAGLGFGIPVSDETRILISGGFYHIDVKNGPIHAPVVYVGFLW